MLAGLVKCAHVDARAWLCGLVCLSIPCGPQQHLRSHEAVWLSGGVQSQPSAEQGAVAAEQDTRSSSPVDESNCASVLHQRWVT